MFKSLKKSGIASLIISLAALTVAEAKVGGPDAFGYSFTDSQEVGGPAFQMVDISQSGTYVVGGDDNLENYSIGFEFPFYGNVYSNVNISTNGWINFGPFPSSTDLSNSAIPTDDTTNNIIAAVWDDITFSSFVGGGVYLQTYENCPNTAGGNNQCTVIMWHAARHFGSTYEWDFEVILYDNGSILFNHGAGNLEQGIGSTTGIENIDASIGLQYSYNTAELSDNLAVLFSTVSATGDIRVTDSVNPNDDLLIPFGLVEMGDYSEEETVTVTNSGDADLIVGKVHLAGGGQGPGQGPSSEDMVHEEPTDFIISSNNCTGQTIAPEGSCTITVQFIPENTCRRKAQLLIHSDDPDEKVVHVRLEGISKGQTMSWIATPFGITYDEQTPEITFPNGPVAIYDEEPVYVNIFNQSDTSKVIHKVELLDGGADRFSIDMNPESNACNKLPHSLQSSESCNISLSYSPIEYGSDHTTLGVFAEENTCYFLDVKGINSSVFAPPPYGFGM